MKLSVRGIDLNYRIDGPDGAPWVAFSNSLATTHRMWDPQLAEFTKQYRVLRYDTRGHGESDVGTAPFTFDLLADDVLGLLDALSIEKTHFVGLSMGGMTGMTIALRRSSILRTLVLCDTASHDPHDPALWQQRIEAIQAAGSMEVMVETALERFLARETVAQRRDVTEAVRAMVRSTPLDGYIGCCQALAQFDLADRLSEVTAPTLVLVGSEDVGTPVHMAEAIHRNIAGSKLVVLAGAAHLSNLDQPTAFNEAVLAFLAEHDRIASQHDES